MIDLNKEFGITDYERTQLVKIVFSVLHDLKAAGKLEEASPNAIFNIILQNELPEWVQNKMTFNFKVKLIEMIRRYKDDYNKIIPV